MPSTKKKYRCRGKSAMKCRRRDGCKFVSGKKRRYCRTLKNKRRRTSRAPVPGAFDDHTDSLHVHLKKQFRDARDKRDIANQHVLHARRQLQEMDAQDSMLWSAQQKSNRKKMKKKLNDFEKRLAIKQKKFDSIQKKYGRMDRELGKLSASHVFY
jgi:hypothetical protein